MPDSALLSVLSSAGVAGVFCVSFMAGLIYPRSVIADKNAGLFVDQFHPYLAVLDKARQAAPKYNRITAGDARGFWELVQPNHDDLKWCGSAPIYTFLKAVPGVEGRLKHYQQWNIDEQSVVSFAGMTFYSSK